MSVGARPWRCRLHRDGVDRTRVLREDHRRLPPLAAGCDAVILFISGFSSNRALGQVACRHPYSWRHVPSRPFFALLYVEAGKAQK